MLFGLWQVQSIILLQLYNPVFNPDMSTTKVVLLNCVPWVVIAVLAAWLRGRFVAALRSVFLILSPLPVILLGNGIFHYEMAARPLETRTGRALPFRASPARVVWLIFDELDSRLLDSRPERIQMPNLMHLESESMVATRATAPTRETMSSIPSLLVGRVAEETQASAGGTDLRVRFRGIPEWRTISSEPTLFRKIRAQGLNVGVAGWHHPYCRIIGDDLSDCTATGTWAFLSYVPQVLETAPFYQKAAYLAMWEITSLPLSSEAARWNARPRGEFDQTSREHARIMQETLTNGLRMVRNRNLNFVYIHLPIPHPPGISPDGSQRNPDYFDNLRLVDSTIGQIRSELERCGDWNDTAVLVTSDHPFRPELWAPSPMWDSEIARISRREWQPYIPFVLKLPNQHKRETESERFNTVITGDLLIEILNGRLRSPTDVSRWLASVK
jgi:hypothetical protein